MKLLLAIAAVSLALVTQATPAPALTKTSPSIRLIPVSPLHVSVNAPARCDAPASVDGQPFFEMPTIAKEQGVHGTTNVKITLMSNGSLAEAELFSSSGNPWLDDAAVLSARMTSFTSEVANCEHVSGTYLYEVTF
jgi:TonB family protein